MRRFLSFSSPFLSSFELENFSQTNDTDQKKVMSLNNWSKKGTNKEFPFLFYAIEGGFEKLNLFVIFEFENSLNLESLINLFFPM
jgi:hypothetical protein